MIISTDSIIGGSRWMIAVRLRRFGTIYPA